MAGIRQTLVRITDFDDPRIVEVRDIRERDLAGRQHRFIAEGRVVLRVLSGSDRFGAEKILILENRLAGLEDILNRFPDDVPVMVADRDILDRVVGFPMHRGVLAIGRRGRIETVPEAVRRLPENALVLAASGISNHDNMGGLFRNAAAFGANLVCLDGACCDPLYRKSIRVSVGAALSVPYAVGEAADDVVSALSDRGFAIHALSPRGHESIADLDPGRRCCLLVGTEGEGLPESLLARLDTVRIPQTPHFDSLNVSTAAGIALFCLATRMGRI